MKKKGGISLRMIHTCLIIGSVILCSLILFATFHLSASFRHLTQTSELLVELRSAASELMEASDYLTEKVQRFTILGEKSYLDDYFNEAFEANHREEAIRRMSVGEGSEEALNKLKDAMDNSVKLMDREYYAMKLVIDARAYRDYPEVLQSVKLSEDDQALTSDEKMRLAASMVHDDVYYSQKEKIRNNMRSSLDALEKMAYDKDTAAMNSVQNDLTFMRIMIIVQTVSILFMVWLTSRLGIHPVLNAVERIKQDSPIPEVGANEFRYLARAYNKMYDVYRSSLEHLNFKASHDELTGAYNRAGYDLLMTSVDMSSTYMLLFDLDNFKGINDTCGHETGDKVLVKLVKVLNDNFRSDDYVCRIGGDEFVVFMVHASRMQHDLIARKIDEINDRLADTSDGLPATSVSVGVVHGSAVKQGESIFEKIDEAMYRAKQGGKKTYRFYESI